MNSKVTIKEYFARDGSEFNKKDAAVIGPVLHEMSQEGGVTARDVVDTARSPNSPIHPYFEWNDKVAADQYRLYQARSMLRSIRVRFIQGGETREARAFQINRRMAYEDEPRRYHTFQVMHGDSAFAAQMMESAIEDLLTWRRKYEPYVGMWRNFGDVFQSVLNQVDEFAEECRVANLSGETDEALARLLVWREECAVASGAWTAAREQVEYVMQAIKDAEATFAQVSETKERTCLKCRKPFQSVHVGNRICKPCLNTKTVNEKSLEHFDAQVGG